MSASIDSEIRLREGKSGKLPCVTNFAYILGTLILVWKKEETDSTDTYTEIKGYQLQRSVKYSVNQYRVRLPPMGVQNTWFSIGVTQYSAQDMVIFVISPWKWLESILKWILQKSE